MADDPQRDKEAEFHEIKHSIRNQLSNIFVSLDQMRYELQGFDPGVQFYLDTIDESCRRIRDLLKKHDGLA